MCCVEIWTLTKGHTPSSKCPVSRAHYLVNAFKLSFFLFLTSSEIQEDNVFTKNIYKEMGNLSDSQRKPIPKNP